MTDKTSGNRKGMQTVKMTLNVLHQAAEPCDECDTRLKATNIVYTSGSTETDGKDIDNKLGDLFSPTRKEQFCQKVADCVKQDPSEIPSDDDNTLRDVRDAIIPYC